MIDFDTRRPEKLIVGSTELANKVWRENFYFNSLVNEEDFKTTYKIVEAAKRVAPAMCNLEGNLDKRGFMLAITKRDLEYPVLNVEIGLTWSKDKQYGINGKREKYVEFATLKTKVLKLNRSFIASGQNLLLESNKTKSVYGVDIPEGAIGIDEHIISVSAFKNAHMDTAAAIAIAVGSKLLSVNEAEYFAIDPRVKCNEFIQYKDEILQSLL